MNKTIIAVRSTGAGMTVEIDATVVEAMQAVGSVIATAVWNMVASGRTAEDAIQQIGICANYGINEGLKKAKEAATHE